MHTLLRDIRYGLRMLIKQPGFTAVAVLTLALGIGVNSAIFSVVNGVILQPLPYGDPDRLVAVYGVNRTQDRMQDPVSLPDFRDFRSENQVFDDIATAAYWTFNLTGADEPERVLGVRSSGNLFSVLGVTPLLGRSYANADDRPGADNVAVMSHGLWQRRFGGDPAVVGSILNFNGTPTTIIGVMPAHFEYPAEDIDLWAPLAGTLDGAGRNGRFLLSVARLKPDIPRSQAQAALATLAGALEQQYPDTNTGWGVNLVPLHEVVVGDVKLSLWLLFGAVGFVLLIACANVANLLLSRATARKQEIAVRLAIGAGHRHLIRQLLTESVLLSVFGGILGVMMAYWSIDLLLALEPSNLPRLDTIAVDIRVLGFTLLLSVLTGIIFGLAPAMQAIRTDTNSTLKDEGRSATGGRSRIRSGLVVAEVTLALVLLIGGGLLIRSFVNLLQEEPGFRTENLLSMQVFLSGPRYGEIQQQKAYIRDAVARLDSTPGIEAAGAITSQPFGSTSSTLSFSIEGRDTPQGEAPTAAYRAISPGYFRMMGISLLRGRAVTQTDREDAPPVLVINQTMAQRFWPGEDPIGKRIQWVGQGTEEGWHEVVGVVGDVKQAGLDGTDQIAVYAPYTQRMFPWLRWTSLLVRTASEPAEYIRTVRTQLMQVDPNQPVYDVATMDQRMQTSMAGRRFNMILLGVFAGVALLLAGIGIYGVMAYAVAQQTREMGIRMALGAQTGDILRMVLRNGMTLTITGIILGLILAGGITHVLTGFLFGITATDPFTFISIALLLTLVSLAACYLPARRATRVDPMKALRRG